MNVQRPRDPAFATAQPAFCKGCVTTPVTELRRRSADSGPPRDSRPDVLITEPDAVGRADAVVRLALSDDRRGASRDAGERAGSLLESKGKRVRAHLHFLGPENLRRTGMADAGHAVRCHGRLLRQRVLVVPRFVRRNCRRGITARLTYTVVMASRIATGGGCARTPKPTAPRKGSAVGATAIA